MTVSVIALADRPTLLPILLWSLLAQTHTGWELLILDQTPDASVSEYCVDALAVAHERGHRVDVLPVDRRGDWGQTEKELAAQTWAQGDALLFPNDDAYYVPTALATFAAQLEAGHDVSVCGWLYDLFNYAPMPPNTQVGHIDVGGFMVTRTRFGQCGWPNKGQTGDGELVQGFLKAGASVALIPNVLYVKN